ncbi:MAG: cytochrome c3 family protein, partial [Bacteroidota bacterium]
MRPVMILLLAATLSLNLAFSLAPSENPAGCLDCHSKILDQEHKHPPAEKKCEICHKANGKTHPVEGVKGFTLVEDIPSLCYECHD